jgi:transcriptional antiterminator/mannitol/fructose-specific phosphotransferase system IIA component (Ntr-type)
MPKIRGRYIQIILYLLEQKYPVSASEILKELNININTFRKDISQIEGLLRENGLSLIIKPKIGLRIVGSPENIENLRKKLNSLGNKTLPRKKKIWYIAETILLSERIPTIEDLCEMLDISRPTVVEYIKEVNNWLSDKGIILLHKPGCGYFIKGKEEDIRDAFVEAFENFSDVEFQKMARAFTEGNFKLKLGILENTDLGTMGKFIEDVQAQIGRRFTDEDALALAITVALSVRRIKKGHAITFETKEVRAILSNPISPVIRNSISVVENQFQVKFTDSDVAYLVLKFVSSKTQRIEGIGNCIATLRFKQIAEEIVQLTNELLGSTINKEDEFVSMLAYHLESTITKINIGAKMENSALGEVKKEYPIAYAVAERVSKRIEDSFHLQIPDEEKGYIAMYVAICLEKVRQPRKKKVVVICPMGLVTSKLLYYQLMNEIPEIDIVQVGAIKELEEGKIQQMVDLIISTVPVYNVNIPHVVVSPMLQQEDKKRIREMLKTGRGNLMGNIGEEGMFDKSLIFPQISVNSSREVIELLESALVKQGFAKEGAVRGALSREEKYPTGLNMDIPIAIPHGGPEFTIRKGFAIATLKNPVKFREMGNSAKVLDVRIVIVPALTGNEEDGNGFYELIQKLKDYKLTHALLQYCSSQDIKRVLRQLLYK